MRTLHKLQHGKPCSYLVTSNPPAHAAHMSTVFPSDVVARGSAPCLTSQRQIWRSEASNYHKQKEMATSCQDRARRRFSLDVCKVYYRLSLEPGEEADKCRRSRGRLFPRSVRLVMISPPIFLPLHSEKKQRAVNQPYRRRSTIILQQT